MIVSHAHARGALTLLVFAGLFMACHEADDDSGVAGEAATRGGATAGSPGGLACLHGPSIPDTGDCTAPLVPGADRRCNLQVGGRTREVLLYAPPSYDACRPAALV